MGEAAPCLVRSLPQPSDSPTQPREMDPLRALKTSVSFGRFESDSLSWEKWSCFSNNRYLEEAEKISKPGSVAEKKALLEAHFKKISSQKANVGTNDHELSNVDRSCTDSLTVLDEMQEKEETNVLDAVERKGLDIDKREDVETETKPTNIVENVIQCAVPKPPKNEDELAKGGSSKQEKMLITDHSNQGNLVSTNKKKQSLNILASKLRSSIKLSPSQPNKDDNAAQTCKKTEKGSLGEKRSTLKSLHMSVDYSSPFGENSKRSAPMIWKTGDPKGVRNFSKISSDTSTSRQTPTRASVAGTLVQPTATIQLQKRIKTQDKPSVPRSTAKSQSPAVDSKTRGLNTQSPAVVSSPFSLRCEGRVAKRKEFFQKLEEKQKVKEAGKVHLQAKSKKKSDDDLKIMRQSTNCSWKLSANSRLDTELPNNHMNKVPSTRSQTPKTVKQLTSSMLVDNDATKAKEKCIRTPIRSSCTMSRKNIKENTSPNIQRWL